MKVDICSRREAASVIHIHGSMLVLLHPAGWANHRVAQAREESVSHSYNLTESAPPGVFSK